MFNRGRLDAADDESGADQNRDRGQPAHDRDEPVVAPAREPVGERGRRPRSAPHGTIFGRWSGSLERERRVDSRAHKGGAYSWPIGESGTRRHGPQTRPTLTAIIPATDDPPTLPICLAAIRAASDGPEETIVIVEPHSAGPASARNSGARQAAGDVLVFVDSDVDVHADVFGRIREAFEREPELVALFGSYDDAQHGSTVSAFRNLLHHHVHQQNAGRASTFWAGLGAVRRRAFLVAGGFDERRFPEPSIEDIELGMRLAADGAWIELDPSLQATHLKQWPLLGMLHTDLFRRGAPWVALLIERRSTSSALNLGLRERTSAAAALGVLVAVATRRRRAALGTAILFVSLNRRFYALLLRKRGPKDMALGILLHLLHQLVAVASVPLGVRLHLERSHERGIREGRGSCR
jgi:Glycosyl transferase family 2